MRPNRRPELHRRLAPLDSDAERRCLRPTGPLQGRHDIPALVPQVYLHYDPYDSAPAAPVRGTPSLASGWTSCCCRDRPRVVIEVDGKQHYAHGDRPAQRCTPRWSPKTAPAAGRLRGLPLRRLRPHPETGQHGDGSGLLRSSRGTREITPRSRPLNQRCHRPISKRDGPPEGSEASLDPTSQVIRPRRPRRSQNAMGPTEGR